MDGYPRGKMKPHKVSLPKSFNTLSNHGLMYHVTLTPTTVQVTTHKSAARFEEVLPKTRYLAVYIGNDTRDGMTGGLGNALLIKLSASTWLYVGLYVCSITTVEPIIGFRSHIGDNNVTYAYAFSGEYTYLFTEQAMIPNTAIFTKDPYETLYGGPNLSKLNLVKESRAVRKALAAQYKADFKAISTSYHAQNHTDQTRTS